MGGTKWEKIGPVGPALARAIRAHSGSGRSGPRPAMALVSSGAAHLILKAKLLAGEGFKWRPYAAIHKKLPDGSAMLSELPKRADAPEGDEQAEEAYCAAVRIVSDVFGKQRRSNTTADEHKMYMRIFDGWLVREGFG